MKNHGIVNQISLFSAIENIQAQEVQKQQDTQKQQEKLKEFLESDCELFDENDFLYYAEVTGKTVRELKKIGKNVPELNHWLSDLDLDSDDLIGIEY